MNSSSLGALAQAPSAANRPTAKMVLKDCDMYFSCIVPWADPRSDARRWPGLVWRPHHCGQGKPYTTKASAHRMRHPWVRFVARKPQFSPWVKNGPQDIVLPSKPLPDTEVVFDAKRLEKLPQAGGRGAKFGFAFRQRHHDTRRRQPGLGQ